MKKFAILLILIIVTGVLVWYFFFRNKSNSSTPTPEPDPGNGSGYGGSAGPVNIPCVNPGSYTDNGFPLVLGSSGSNVQFLQYKLNELGASLEIDGKLGCDTYRAMVSLTGNEQIDSSFELLIL